MNVRGRSAHPQEAITTVNRATLGRLERNGRFNPAQGAFNCHLNSLAPLRVVFQSLVGEEELFSCSEDKLFIAIYTSQYLILVFVHCGPPTPCSPLGSVLTVLRDRSISFYLWQ
jgi:hypothetical protein